MAAELLVTRGLPGCGKTTFAHAWVAEDRPHRARVNRDDLRQMVDNGLWDGQETEGRIIAARNSLIRGLLKRNVSVINDDTNLPNRTVRDLKVLADKEGASFRIHDMSNVPLETALSQNQSRDDKDPLPEDVIISFHNRFVKGQPYPLLFTEPEQPVSAMRMYVPDPSLPRAIVVDIDGTVALKGTRSPYDETRVHEDAPNQPVIDQVVMYVEAGYRIIFLSGRHDSCYQVTLQWLKDHVGVVDELFMRPAGDNRKDSIVKYELFDRNVRGNYAVHYVLDDRDQVVEMWREIGLPCWQVAPGNF